MIENQWCILENGPLKDQNKQNGKLESPLSFFSILRLKNLTAKLAWPEIGEFCHSSAHFGCVFETLSVNLDRIFLFGIFITLE